MAIGRNLQADIAKAVQGTRITDFGEQATTAPPPRAGGAAAAPPAASAPAPSAPSAAGGGLLAASFNAPSVSFTPAATAPPPRPPATAAATSAAAGLLNFNPGMLAIDPGLLIGGGLRPVDFVMRTATQVAQSARERLRTASASVVGEALTTVGNKRVAPREMMRYLERKVIIGEVLNQSAAQWSADTRQDFADAFQMAVTKTDVMDAIVAVAILNDPDLPDELRDENAANATGADLLENRRVVAQYPPPGTPLEAPYLVLVAVEYRDTRRADEIIESIIGDLVEQQGFKVPRPVAQSLR